MRKLFFGVLAGLLLSLLRAPLGVDLLQIPAVEAHTALGVRALALVVIAGAVLSRASFGVSSGMLFGALLGYAGHGLLLGNDWAPGSRLAIVAVALVGLALLVGCARGIGGEAEEAQGAPAPGPGFGEMLSFAISGAGLATGLELIARHLRLHGTQLSADDSVFASVLLLLVFVGGAAFGWIARIALWRAYAPGLLLALAGAALFVSLHVLATVTNNPGLRAYVHPFGLDLSQHGTPAYDALLAGAFFVAPAFAIGCALRALAGRKRIFALLLGAAAGLCALPAIFDTAPGMVASDKHTFAAQFVALASLVAVCGGAGAILCLPGKPSLPRWAAILLALACAAPAALISVAQQSVLAPWRRQTILPYLYFDAPEGLVTVEGPLMPQGTSPLVNKSVTLERRLLVPGPEGTRGDLVRIDLALAQLPQESPERKDKRALIVGQLRPLLARRLADRGFAEIDRSAAWWLAMDRIEHELFSQTALPKGDFLAPAAARERLDAGRYDFVLVPQTSGDAPRLSDLRVPQKTLLVVWLDAALGLSSSELGERVLVSALGLDEPSVAVVVHGRAIPESEPLAPQYLRAGAPARAPRPLSWISARSEQRDQAARARLFERFAVVARGTSDEPLARGLAAVYAAQATSSPFDSQAERFELPADALQLLREAGLARKPNAFVAQLWEWTGNVLAEKRWIPQIYEHVEPLAKAWAPWPALERVLARADAESLDFASAVKRLEALRESEQGRDPDFWVELGDAQQQLGHTPETLAAYRKSSELAPGLYAPQRKLAMALVRAGDPAGHELVEKLLQQNAKDEELKVFLGPGPYPPLQRGFEPQPKPAH